MKRLVYLLTIAVVAAQLSGCNGTREVVREVPVYIHDTTYQSSVLHDSIYVEHYTEVNLVGDTIWVTKSVTKSVTKLKHDTIYSSQEMPIEITRVERIPYETQVAKPLSRWQRMQVCGFWWLTAAVVAYLLWRTRRWWRRVFLNI